MEREVVRTVNRMIATQIVSRGKARVAIYREGGGIAPETRSFLLHFVCADAEAANAALRAYGGTLRIHSKLSVATDLSLDIPRGEDEGEMAVMEAVITRVEAELAVTRYQLKPK